MLTTEMKMDNFARNFSTAEEMFFALKDIEMESTWSTEESNKLEVEAITSMADAMQMITDEEVLDDTIKNTALLIRLDNKTHALRDCAISTLLDRAKISGAALSKVNKEVLQNILNYCLEVATGNALIRYSCGKVSALLSADDYIPISIPTLFDETQTFLDYSYPSSSFIGGYTSHSITTALWKLASQRDKLITEYVNILKEKETMYKNTDFMPVLKLITSDIGNNAVTLVPMAESSKGFRFRLNGDIKLIHKGDSNIEKYKENLGMIYAKFVNSQKRLIEMLDIEIINPINCITAVAKRVGIPKSLYATVVESFRFMIGDNVSNAHDIYLTLNEVIFDMQINGASQADICRMEDTVARALSLNFKQYDLSVM